MSSLTACRIGVALSHEDFLVHMESASLGQYVDSFIHALTRFVELSGARVLIVMHNAALLRGFADELNAKLSKASTKMCITNIDPKTEDTVSLDFVSEAQVVVDLCGWLDSNAQQDNAILRNIASVLNARRATPQSRKASISIRNDAVSPPEDRFFESRPPFVVSIEAPTVVASSADVTFALTGVVDPLLLTFPAAEHCGELIALTVTSAPPSMPLLLTREMARELLPARPRNGHKGTFGTALICAGSSDYWGAPLLSARGALRAGAGIVALAVPPALRVAIASTLPEVTMPGLSANGMTDSGCLSAAAAHHLLAGAVQRRVRAVLAGPGMNDASEFLTAYVANPVASKLALVLDADALNALPSLGNEWWTRLPRDTVLTPHPGEMERLTGVSLIGAMSCEQRLELAIRFAKQWRVVVLLKGAFTVVASPDGVARVLPFASPALAIGGSGDVLAGIIVALRAQGVDAFDAAVVGGFLHGTAGLILEDEHGASGVLAHELAEYVTKARQTILEQ